MTRARSGSSAMRPEKVSRQQRAAASVDWRTRLRPALPFLPIVLVLGPVAVSIFAWLAPTPPSGIGGFFQRSAISIPAALLVIGWFAVLAAAACVGFDAGRRGRLFSGLAAVSEREVQLTATVVGSSGVLYAYWTATNGRLGVIRALWADQQFNQLRQGLEYGVGLGTLRYATVIAGGIALANIVCKIRFTALDGFALASLIAASFLASRLSIIMAVAVAFAAVAGNRERAVATRRLVAAALGLVLLFVGLNFSRNAATYRDAGVGNPIAAAAINAQAYVGVPMQVTTAVTAEALSGHIDVTSDFGAGIGLLIPSYVANSFGVKLGQPVDGFDQPYLDRVDLQGDFTTNGSIVDILLFYGWAGIPAALVGVGAFSWLGGQFFAAGGVGRIFAAITLFGLAELWRLFLFSQGIYHFLVIFGLGAVLVGSSRRRRASALVSEGSASGVTGAVRRPRSTMTK